MSLLRRLPIEIAIVLVFLTFMALSCDPRLSPYYVHFYVLEVTRHYLHGEIIMQIRISYQDEDGANVTASINVPNTSREAVLFGHAGAEGCLVPSVVEIRLVKC